MDNETGAKAPSLHTLIPLEDFKALLGVDDRDDKISRFCLVTATCAIEQYCKRRLLFSINNEQLTINTLTGGYAEDSQGYFYAGGLDFVLKEYPVREILTVSALYYFDRPDLIEPELYHAVPDCGSDVDLPFYLSLSPALLRLRGLSGFKVIYSAGYVCGEAGSSYGVPADLASACLELAGWNLNRYRGRCIGVSGNIRKDGERFEPVMPENVRMLLEPYRRRVI